MHLLLPLLLSVVTVRHRRLRTARPAQRDLGADVGRAHAQRGQRQPGGLRRLLGRCAEGRAVARHFRHHDCCRRDRARPCDCAAAVPDARHDRHRPGHSSCARTRRDSVSRHGVWCRHWCRSAGCSSVACPGRLRQPSPSSDQPVHWSSPWRCGTSSPGSSPSSIPGLQGRCNRCPRRRWSTGLRSRSRSWSCFVALLVQVYSIRYMRDEVRYASYAAFISLFTSAMLAVVVAGDLLLARRRLGGHGAVLLPAHRTALGTAGGAASSGQGLLGHQGR